MSDVSFVLDASALIAVINIEPGEDVVRPILSEAAIGAVNYSEVVAKLQERGLSDEAIDLALGGLELTVIPFDEAQADLAGRLRAPTRSLGLSLGDRACLALARIRGATALTTDRSWAGIDLGISVRMIR